MTFKALSITLCSFVCLWAINSFAVDTPKTNKPKIKIDPQIGGMQLLPGYKHIKLQGIDSIVGKIEKQGGLTISYEIGHIPKPGGPRFGGSFTDRPKNIPAKNRKWYQEQVVNGQPMHLAQLKNDYLLVSFPLKGMNFSVKVKDSAEMAEVLLMLMTYPTLQP